MQFNLADIYESVADVIGEREALVCGSSRLTYGQLEARANRLAHHFLSAGVGPGDHVGVQLYNGPEYVETMLACLKIRAVPININYRYVTDELAYLYHDADLVAVVYDVEFTERVEPVAEKTATIKHLLAVGDLAKAGTGRDTYELALAEQSESRDFPQRSGDDLYIIYTGGTTGMPKGVMWRQEDLFFAGMGGGEPNGTAASTPEDVAAKAVDRYPLVMFPVAPLMHGAAQLATWIGFWMAAKVLLVRKFDPIDVLESLEREGANSLSIVGDAMARPLAESLAGPMSHINISTVFAISSAGAILSAAVREKLASVFPKALLLDNFGASETGFQGTGVAGSSPDAGLRFTVNERSGVLDDDFQQVLPGSGVIGRLAQRRNIPLGYYGDEQKTAETFVVVDGERWVLLGDMATVEADGSVSVLGRKAVCINTGGEKVFPEEVEAGLKAHPAVFDAVVAGIADERYGQRVAAVIEVRDGVDAPTPEELAQHCRGRLAGYKVPRLFVFVAEIRRSPSGKPDYQWASAIVAESAAAETVG